MARHGDTVWRVCLTALCRHADAEDAFQNSFLKYALADDVQFREEEHRKAWLIRVASNTCRDMRRAAASKNVPLDETSFESLMSRDEEAQPDSRVKEVLDAMSLPALPCILPCTRATRLRRSPRCSTSP